MRGMKRGGARLMYSVVLLVSVFSLTVIRHKKITRRYKSSVVYTIRFMQKIKADCCNWTDEVNTKCSMEGVWIILITYDFLAPFKKPKDS